MEFENVEKFENWLHDNLKTETFDLNEYLNDLGLQHGNTGTTSYEVGGVYTKSGNAECYTYDVEEIHNEEEDTWKTIYRL